jgi:hypothetical protein
MQRTPEVQAAADTPAASCIIVVLDRHDRENEGGLATAAAYADRNKTAFFGCLRSAWWAEPSPTPQPSAIELGHLMDLPNKAVAR